MNTATTDEQLVIKMRENAAAQATARALLARLEAEARELTQQLIAVRSAEIESEG
jgi:hypothetical protein